MINRLGKQIQLSPWYIPYGSLEDRGLLQCHAPAASLQLREQPRAGLLARWKSSTCQGEPRALILYGDRGLNWYKIFPGSLPQYVPNPIAKSCLTFTRGKGASLCSNMAQWITWIHPWLWGIFYLVLLLGPVSDCPGDASENTDSSAQEEQKKQPNNLLF